MIPVALKFYENSYRFISDVASEFNGPVVSIK